MNAPATLARRRPARPPDPPPPPRRRFTEAEYLAYERAPTRANAARTELHLDGTLHEMSGVLRPHSLLVRDLNREVDQFLDEETFELHSESVKFRPPRCAFYYPDIMVVPNPPEMLDEVGDVVRNPVFVAEVLSRSTEATDRGEKQDCYLNTPSVSEYWLVSQDTVRVERHHREPGGDWDFTEYRDRAASVPLPALGGAVSLDRLYRRALPAG